MMSEILFCRIKTDVAEEVVLDKVAIEDEYPSIKLAL